MSNLNLLSTTNEAKIEKPEIKQQIPVKLSSKLSVGGGGGRDKAAKKLSSINKVHDLDHSHACSAHKMISVAATVSELVKRFQPERLNGEHRR